MSKLAEIKHLFNEYFERGLPVAPVVGKRMIISDWSKWCNRLPTEEEIESFENGTLVKEATGIALILGNSSGIIAIDIDVDDPEVLALVPSSPVRKRGAKGETRFFKMNHLTRNLSKRNRGAYDLLVNGTYTVLPPSTHPETNKDFYWLTEDTLLDFDLDDLPELENLDFLDIIDKMYPTKGKDGGAPVKHVLIPSNGTRCAHNSHTILSQRLVAKVLAGEAFEDIVQSCLKHDEEINDKVSYFLCPSRIEFKTKDRYKNAVRFVSEAFKARYKDIPIPTPPVKLLFIDDQEKVKTTSFKQKSYMRPKGLMSDVIDTIIATSVRENYALALGGAISLLSTFASNRFRFNKTWTNTFVLCLAETGAGKSFHQNFIREILLEFDSNLLGHGNYASSPAITISCKSQRERLDIIDEVSTLFNAMASGGSYQKDMVEELSKIWSSSGQLYKASASKTKEDTASAYNICININGSSTIDGVKSAINKEMVTKGLIPRFLIFIEEGYSDVKMQEEPSTEVFTRMMQGFHKISKINKNKLDCVDILLGPKYDPKNVFPTDEKAIKFYKEEIYLNYNNKIKDQETDEAKQIMTRACENIAKLAVCHFVSRMAYDESLTHVEIQDLFWAKNVYDSCSHNASMFISESAVDSDYERDLKQIKSIISKNPNGVLKSFIKNRVQRIDEQKIDKILSHLSNSGEIVQKKVENKVNNTSCNKYFLVDMGLEIK